MARKAKFKKGDTVTKDGWVMIVQKDQYLYRNKPVVNIADGEKEYTRVPVAEVMHYKLEEEVIAEQVTEGHTPSKPMNKYQRVIKNADGQEIIVDVYDVLQAFNVTNSALAHAIKKALAPGQRGHKSEAEDLQDIKVSVERSIQLYYNRTVG